MNVYIENSSNDYRQMFAKLGYTVVSDVDEASLVCFTGGEDVSPVMYGDATHHTTYNNLARDVKEQRLFNHCLENGIAMVGICRGGQFLNVMSGGRMYQDISEHCGDHSITDTRTGDTIYVSSTHHQMIMPSEKALVVATAALGGTREWYDGEIFRKDVSKEDIEVVYYEHTNCLCFQPHPEFSRPHYAQMTEYFGGLLVELLSYQTVEN